MITNDGNRQRNHKIETKEIKKKGLANYDNKKYILEDGVSSLPFGHYFINRFSDSPW